VRGSLRFRAARSDFARCDWSPGLTVQSSGTSNRPLSGHVALDWLAIWTFSKGIFLEAYDLLSSFHAVYDAILPAPAAIYGLLHNGRLGIATDRWFAQKMPANNWIADARPFGLSILSFYWGNGLARDFHDPSSWVSETFARFLIGSQKHDGGAEHAAST